MMSLPCRLRRSSRSDTGIYSKDFRFCSPDRPRGLASTSVHVQWPLAFWSSASCVVSNDDITDRVQSRKSLTPLPAANITIGSLEQRIDTNYTKTNLLPLAYTSDSWTEPHLQLRRSSASEPLPSLRCDFQSETLRNPPSPAKNACSYLEDSAPSQQPDRGTSLQSSRGTSRLELMILVAALR